MKSAYQICTKCVMDTTDLDIQFDENGVCNHCKSYEHDKLAFPLTEESKEEELRKIVARIQEAGRGKPYDCIIGLSGGVDSTYVAYKIKELGLRPLAIHVDNGWNSELAVKNIELVVKNLGIDLYTHVLDWEEFRDLQMSFIKASVPDCEIPTDHAIVAVLFDQAVKNGIRYVISGNNHVTEGVLPISYSYGCFDWRYIKGIHKRFGTKRLKTFPHFSLFGRLYYVFIRKLRNIGILNYMAYDKAEAMATIEREIGWKYYGGKHYESIYTRFYQGYILPRKFDIDKRRAHLSALICSKQILREEALDELKKETYPEELIRQDREYVSKKFGISVAQFDSLMAQPIRRFEEFPTYYPFLQKTRWLVRCAKSIGLMPKRVGI